MFYDCLSAFTRKSCFYQKFIRPVCTVCADTNKPEEVNTGCQVVELQQIGNVVGRVLQSKDKKCEKKPFVLDSDDDSNMLYVNAFDYVV